MTIEGILILILTEVQNSQDGFETERRRSKHPDIASEPLGGEIDEEYAKSQEHWDSLTQSKTGE